MELRIGLIANARKEGIRHRCPVIERSSPLAGHAASHQGIQALLVLPVIEKHGLSNGLIQVRQIPGADTCSIKIGAIQNRLVELTGSSEICTP